jgi:hypothetical protein
VFVVLYLRKTQEVIMIRNIQKTLDNWSKKYNTRFSLNTSSWGGATVRESSSFTDRPHIAIGMTSKNQNEEEWRKERDQIMGFFPRFFEIDFSTQKALVFIDERNDD